MTFARTTNYELIRSTITHPAIYRWHTDAASPDPEHYSPRGDVLYIAVHDGPEYLGLFCLVPHDPLTMEIHTCLLPLSWGKRATQAYREGIAWVWNATHADRIIGRIRRDNRLALRIALKAGLTVARETVENSNYIIEVELKRWAELRKGSGRESLAA